METSSRPARRAVLKAIALAALTAAPAAAADPVPQPLDPMAQAVVHSLRVRRVESPADLVESAALAADVEALADAVDFFRQFLDAVGEAGDRKADVLADVGDRVDPGALRRLQRLIAPFEPEGVKVLDAAVELAGRRRRDPARLTAAAAALGDPSATARTAAAGELARSRTAALPALVGLLETDDAAGHRARSLARGIIHEMGAEGRQALLAWLGSDDVDRWPGVIAALAASDDEDTDFFLAPAMADDVPPAVRRAARAALAAAGDSPSPDEARARLATRLDRLLTQDGLPPAASLTDKEVEWAVWNPQRRAVERLTISTRLARAQTAIHLARDLSVFVPTDPAQVRLMLLARLEMLTALAGERPGAIAAIPAEPLRAALAGPEGFDQAIAADVLDEAAARGLTVSAAAAARAIREANAAGVALPPPVRGALVRAITAPDDPLAFEAARTLAECGGNPPYPGASLVVKTLIHAATSTGIDRAVVAHPDDAVVAELAAGLALHGYQAVRVHDGRDAILATRESADTVLVVLAARLGRPSALETTQFLQRGSDRAAPPVLVVVDPLDDDPRGRFLTCLIQAFTEMECVAIVDRMESFFAASKDAETGADLPPRFLDALAVAAGPTAADPELRGALAAARLERACTALAALEGLADRGWDVQAAVPVARLALAHEKLHTPAKALLRATGRMYNRPTDTQGRALAGNPSAPITTPSTQAAPVRADAP